MILTESKVSFLGSFLMILNISSTKINGKQIFLYH